MTAPEPLTDQRHTLNARRRERYATDPEFRDAEHARGRARYERLKFAGLCTKCAQDVVITETLCFDCAGKKDTYNSMRPL